MSSDSLQAVNMVLVVLILALVLGGNFKLLNMQNELETLKTDLIRGLKSELDAALSAGDIASLHQLSARLGDALPPENEPAKPLNETLGNGKKGKKK